MKSAPTLVSIASLAMLALTAASPAQAQRTPAAAQRSDTQKAQPQAAQPGAATAQRKLNISKAAQKPLSELQSTVNAADAANFPVKLAAAEAVAKSPDERYFIGQLRLNMALKGTDRAAQRAAIDAIVRSGGAQQDELPKLYRALGGLSYEAKDYDAAIAAYTKFLEFQPGDEDITNNLIIIHRDRKAYPQAIAIVQESIAKTKSAGKQVPERLYLIGLQTALDAKSKPQMVSMTRELLAAYPNAKNWSNGLNIYRQASNLDDEATLDTLRLMRATKSLARSNEYIALADTLARGRYYAEARDVVNEGIASGKYTRTNASAAAVLSEVSGKIAGDKTALAGLEGRARSEARGDFALKIADGYYGHGDYAKAADFYRLALQKGTADANLVNTRLGMALAQSGRKSEAEAAFKAVTGPRSELASLWMLWLNQRG